MGSLGKEKCGNELEWKQERKHPASLCRKVKLLTAGSIFCGNVALGCSLNTYGPSLTSFEKKFGSDSETISLVFSVTVGAMLLGALSSGFLYKIVNRQLAVAAFFGGMGAVTFILPFCPNLTSFFVAAGLIGFLSGFYESAQFVWMMEMMEEDCPPYVQAQHFSYALGANLVTFIMAPFVDKAEKTQLELISNETEEEPRFNLAEESKLFIPFSIVTGFLTVAMSYQIILFIFYRYHSPTAELAPEMKQTSVQSNQFWHKIRLIFLSCCFFGAVQGMEMTVVQLLPKFGQVALSLSESSSAYVLTSLTTAYAVARFICIFIVYKIPSQKLLIANLLITAVAVIIFVGWAQSSLTLLWTSSILFGLGFSSMYAGFSSFIERYLKITDSIGALMLVVGSGVAAIYPFSVGKWIDSNPLVLGYTAAFSTFLATSAFTILSFIVHKDKNKY